MGTPEPGRVRQGRTPGGDGDEPDPRWSLANERTLLAYVRTSLSLLVSGLAIAASHTVADTPAWLAALGLPLIAAAVAVALSARTRFFASQRAMRRGDPLSVPSVATLVPWAVALVGAAGIVLAAVGLV